jgi:hypothetical protein
MTSRLRIALLLLVAGPAAAAAQSGSDMGTSEQRNACGPDVGHYCKSLKPDDGPFAYLNCLQQNREKLRPACLKIIEVGGEAPEPKKR